ncbi:MAG: ArnT family glycosyltransferase [Bacteroidales bacterium]
MKENINRSLAFILLGILYLFSLFTSLNQIEIRGAEPKRAIVSMEMDLNNDYIVPTIHNETYYNKPPMFNWLQILFFKAFNSYDEVVCRLPGILSFILIGIGTFLLGRFIFDRNTGIVAAIFYLSFLNIYFYGTVYAGSVDIFLSLLIFLQIGSLIFYSSKENFYLLFIISYTLAAIGFLTKGLPSIMVQFISLIVLLIMQKRIKKLFGLAHFSGILIFLLLIVAYFTLYSKHEDVVTFLVNTFAESSKRYDTSHGFIDYLTQLFHIPDRFLVTHLMPWSLLLLLLVKKKIRRLFKESSELLLITLLLFSNIFLYFFAPDYSDRYLYPLVVAITQRNWYSSFCGFDSFKNF